MDMLEESPLTSFLQVIWKNRPPSADDLELGIRIPNTVVYEHNFPKGLFHTTPSGRLQRRVGKEIDSRTVVEEFCSTRIERRAGKQQEDPAVANPSEGSLNDIVALWMERMQDSGQYSVQFLTTEGLRRFLFGAAVGGLARGRHSKDEDADDADAPAEQPKTSMLNKNGILQRFVYPRGNFAEQIQVVWTSHLCFAEKARNNHSLHDYTKTPFQRAATFEGPPSFCSRTKIAPKLVEAIRTKCEFFAEKIFNVMHRPVERMTLYFTTDASDSLWLLRCPFLRLATPSLSNLRRPLSASFAANSSTSYRRPGTADTKNYSDASQSGILPDFDIPLGYQGSMYSDDAQTEENKRRKNELMYITMGATFVAVTEAALLSDNPTKVMQEMRRAKSAGPYGGANGQRSNSTVVPEEATFRPPTLTLRCMDQRPNSSAFVPGYRSRLCPKMRWLEGRALTVQRPKTTLFEKGELIVSPKRRKPQVLSAQQEQQHERRAAGDRTAIQPSDTLAGRSGDRHAKPGPTGYKRTVYTMTTPSVDPGPPPALTPITLHTSRKPRPATELEIVKQLTRLPPHPLLLPTSAETEENADSAWYYAQRMQKTKDSIDRALTLLEGLRPLVFGHFLLHENQPLPISLPVYFFTCDSVHEAMVKFLSSCLPRITMAEAVAKDLRVDRCGVIDDWSNHHHVIENQNHPQPRHHRAAPFRDANTAQEHRGVTELPCFEIESVHVAGSLVSRFEPFFLVDLRNVHADVEYSLVMGRQAALRQRVEDRAQMAELARRSGRRQIGSDFRTIERGALTPTASSVASDPSPAHQRRAPLPPLHS